MKRYIYPSILFLLAFSLISGCASLGKRATARNQGVREPALLELEKENERTKGETAEELIAYLGSPEFADKDYAVEALVRAGKNSPEVLQKITANFAGKEPTVRNYLEEVMVKSGYDAVPALLQGLKSENKYIRLHSAYSLGLIKPPVKEAIPGLIELLKDEDSAVNSAARDALIANGQVDVTVLLKKLSDESPSVRYNIAFILGRIGSDKTAVLPLSILLKDENILVRTAATDTLIKIASTDKSSIREICGLFRGSAKDPKFDTVIINILGKAGENAAEAAPVVLQYLMDSGNLECKGAAAEALSKIVPKDNPAAVMLIKALSNSDGEVRSKAAAALGDMQVMQGEILTALVKMFEDNYVYARASAQASVEKLAPYAKDKAAALLLACLKSGDKRTKVHAILALGNLNIMAKESMPELLRLLNDKDKDVRRAVTEAFGILGLYARESAPGVINALKDSEKDVRIEAEKTLERLGFLSKDAVASMAEAFKDKDPEFTGTIKRVLFRIGPVAISALVKKLNDENADVRQNVASVLGKIGRTVPNIREALEGLTALLSDKNPAVRIAAATSLGEVGMNNKEIISGLIDVLRDTDPEVRFAAATALGKIGALAKDAAPYLVGLLKDENNKVRNAARDALSSIGNDAVDPLLEALKNQDEKVRLAAVQALEKIGSQKAREAIKSYRGRFQ